MLPLIDSPEVIAARAGHPLAKSRRLVDLAGASWVLTGPMHGPGDPVHLGLEALGLSPPRVTLECDSFSTLLAVLPGMDAVALMPQRFFDSHGPRTGLVALPITDALPQTTIHLFCRTRRAADLAHPAPQGRFRAGGQGLAPRAQSSGLRLEV